MCMSKSEFEHLATTAVWHSKNGPTTARQMSSEHLRNAALCVQFTWCYDQVGELSRDQWCWIFYNELHRREVFEERCADMREKIARLESELRVAREELKMYFEY